MINRLEDATLGWFDNGSYIDFGIKRESEYRGVLDLGNVCSSQFVGGPEYSEQVVKRLAACWNRFNGMSLEDIEAGMMPVAEKAQSAYHKGIRLLTDDQVRYIRTSGKPIRHMARELGVSKSVIDRCLAWRTYKDIR